MATCNLRYGRLFGYPSCLQCLNKIQVAVCFISIANCFLMMSYSLIGVIISTIEKRYDLSSVQSSWIASAGDLGAIPVLAMFIYYGNRIHRPRSIGLGLLSVSLGCIVFFIPQFTSPTYDPGSNVTMETNSVCGAVNNSVNHVARSCDRSGESSISYELPLFIVSRLFIGFGSAPIISLAVSYMSDCSTKNKFELYSAIYYSTNILGPSISFIAGGFIIDNLYVDFYAVGKTDLAFGPKDPRWIGAWWLLYVVSAAVCLIFAFPMFGYARDLPGAPDIRGIEPNISDNNDTTATQERRGSDSTEQQFGALLRDILTNPTFDFLCIFTICDLFIISGFTAFGTKFVQFQFSMSPSKAALIFGAVIVPACAIGSILSGVILEKSKISGGWLVRVMAILSVIVCALIFVMFISCKEMSLVGVNAAYGNSSDETGFTLLNPCNVECGCQDYGFNPVCSHDNVQYFSACHAGCRNFTTSGDQKVNPPSESTREYHDCSCVSTPHDQSYQATSDICSGDMCAGAIAFLAVLFVAVGNIYVTLTMNLSATTSCVKKSQKTSSYAIQVLIVKGFGAIPGPILMGLAFDNSCAYWVFNECGERTSCALYHNRTLSLNLFVLCIVVKSVGTIAILLAAVFYKDPQLKNSQTDDEQTSNNRF